jgi:hypothetical protein
MAARALSPVADPSRLAALRRAPQDDGNPLRCLIKKIFAFLIPVPQGGLIIAPVLSDEEPLSRSDPSLDRARAGRTGAPRNGRQAGGQGGAPGGAAPYVTGRARCLAARGGYVNPASKGATSLRPGASRRSIASRGSRGIGKPRTHCAARTRKCGCLKFELEFYARRFLNLAPLFRGERSARSAG